MGSRFEEVREKSESVISTKGDSTVSPKKAKEATILFLGQGILYLNLFMLIVGDC